MRYCQLVAAAGLAAIACSVQAQSSVVIGIANPTETDKIVNDPVVAVGSLVLPDSSASGYANLETGILRSESIGPPIQPGLGYADGQFSSQSAAQIVDTITFGAGASGTGFLDWHVDGTLTPVIDIRTNILWKFAIALPPTTSEGNIGRDRTRGRLEQPA